MVNVKVIKGENSGDEEETTNDVYSTTCSNVYYNKSSIIDLRIQYNPLKGEIHCKCKSCKNSNAHTKVSSVFIVGFIALLFTPLGTNAIDSTCFSRIFRAGPKPCLGGEGKGYSNLDDLRNDLNKKNQESPDDGGEFVLCPNTKFSFSLPSTRSISTFTTSTTSLNEEQDGDNDLNDFNNNNRGNPSSIISAEFGYEDWDSEQYGSNKDDNYRRDIRELLQEEDADFPWNEVQDLDSFLMSTGTTADNGANSADENDDFTNEVLSVVTGRAVDLGSFNNNSSDMQITANIPANNAQDPLVITASNTIIKCGEDGSVENNCEFNGGQNQIVVGGNASNVLIMGITFREAQDVAVVSSGNTDSSVTVMQCKFEVRVSHSSQCNEGMVAIF